MNNRAVASVGILGFLAVVIMAVTMGALLIPEMMRNITNSTALGLTGNTATAVDIIPTIFFLVIIVVGMGAVIIAVNR